MIDSLIALTMATLFLLGSPGPATLALAAAGASFGFKKGLPFLAGILAGLLVVIVGTSFGMASFFSNWPKVALAAQILSALYILLIAFKIASAPIPTPTP